jgi:lipopolysaccharide transport system ATP-binding protein
MRFLRHFQKHGTILFVSHDTTAIANLCQRVIWLDSGNVRGIGEAKTITERYLQSYYEAEQGPSSEAAPPATPSPASNSDLVLEATPAPMIDQDFASDTDPLGGTSATNSFGKGGLVITNVRLLNAAGNPIYSLTGRERASLTIQATVRQPIERLLAGFYVRDRLGQILFGDNTHHTYMANPISLGRDQHITARFDFEMPMLATGDYVITVAVGEGTQEEHIIHHWIHDALAFKSLTRVPNGLLGISMHAVELVVCD